MRSARSGGAVVDDGVGAGRQAPVGVGVPGRGDHPDARTGGQLDGGDPDVAGAAADEHRPAGPDPGAPEPAEVGGDRRMRHGHRQLRVDPVGQPVQPLAGDDREVGGGPLPTGVAEAVGPHRVPDGEVADRGPDLGDRAHEIAADDERNRDRGVVPPLRT